MPNTAKGTPYVQSSDLVSAYPTVSLSLANHIDNNVAYNAVTFNNQTGTTYTFVLADASTGRITTASNAAAQTYTIPPQTSVAWASGAVIRLVNIGAGAVTVVGGAGVTVSNAASAIGQWESVSLLRTGSDTWALVRGGLGKAQYSSATGSPSVDTTSRPGKTIVTFTGSGSVTCTAGTVELLVVGGGGGGSGTGGGGAGGHLYIASAYVPADTLTVTVGAGGAKAAVNVGETSRLGNYFATGGGCGSLTVNGASGFRGGSGGGGRGAGTGGAAITGLGNSGGNGATSEAGGGGGGAGAAGSNATTNAGGAGGNGTSNSITGSAVTRAGGGGGAGSSTAGGGGTGGGGAGSVSGISGNGQDNTGGGGGGNFNSAANAGNGGTGVVIVVFG